ncbi:MAG: LemA family protein [Candidatus Liptonbacteria bacterium]|nr:LemA family protein [Candidatus Liptonbacteria bacterium]
MTILYVLIAVAVVAVLWFVVTYNGFVKLVNRTKEAWADIDVQLKRSYDLIPNLLETVKGYATHERESFESVTKARAQALGAQTVKEKEQADNMVTSALKSLFAIAENYPNLRAVESFISLQNELSDTENKIQAARRFYNGNVRDLNTRLETFPASIVGNMFGFEKREFFELEAQSAEKEPVKVKF